MYLLFKHYVVKFICKTRAICSPNEITTWILVVCILKAPENQTDLSNLPLEYFPNLLENTYVPLFVEIETSNFVFAIVF